MAASHQTTAQTTVSTTTVSATASSTSGHHRSSAVATTSAAAAANASSSSSDNTGVIVGAAIGGGIGLILVILLGWFLWYASLTPSPESNRGECSHSCHSRRRHDKKGDYIQGDKLNQSQFDRNAMVRPTPYPYRDPSEGSDYFSVNPGRPRNNRKTVPALNPTETQSPSATPPSPTANSRAQMGSSSVANSDDPSTSETAAPTPSRGRQPTRTVAFEGTPSPSNPPPRGQRTPGSEVVGLARLPPLPEKDRYYLHPDRGLTVIPHGEGATSSGSSARGIGNAPPRNDVNVSGSERRQESHPRGGRETGVQEAALGVAREWDRQGTQEIRRTRQLAPTGIARDKRRMLDRCEESEGEAPPAYCE